VLVVAIVTLIWMPDRFGGRVLLGTRNGERTGDAVRRPILVAW
jgi:hypothetical protein